MQGYTYTKGEHYPVEHLVFKVAPRTLNTIWRLTMKSGH